MQRTHSTHRRLLAVFVGGFFGTITRYLLSLLIQAYLGKSWPYDILTINVTGAFVLAFVTTLADATFLVGPTRRLFINVGFLGAYTTFSSMALGDLLLFTSGRLPLAILYIIISIVGGILAVFLGDGLGTWSVRRFRSNDKQVAIRTEFSEHLDMQGDVLLPDEIMQRKIERH